MSMFATPAPKMPQQSFTPQSVSGLITPSQATPQKSANMDNSLVPVTVTQLEIHAPSGEAIHGKQLKTVCLVGQIRNCEKEQTKCEFYLDDSTGLIKCIWYTQDGSVDTVQQNTYVKVYGKPQKIDGQYILNVYHVRQITSYNEITYHMLETCYAHKLRLGANNANVGPGGALNFNNQQPQMQMQPNQAANRIDFNQEEKAVGAIGNIGNGMPEENDEEQVSEKDRVPFRKEIIQILAQGEPDVGMAVDDCIKQIGVQHAQTIRSSISQLAEHGDIYSTMDDEHYAFAGGDGN